MRKWKDKRGRSEVNSPEGLSKAWKEARELEFIYKVIIIVLSSQTLLGELNEVDCGVSLTVCLE